MDWSHYIPFLFIIPLVAYAMIRGLRGRSQWLKDNAHHEVGNIANRFGWQLVEGPANLNLVMTNRQSDIAQMQNSITMSTNRPEIKVLLRGKTYGRETELYYFDRIEGSQGLLEKTVHRTFVAYVRMKCDVAIPNFEILSRNPQAYVEPEAETDLPEIALSDVSLNQHLILKGADPVLGNSLTRALMTLAGLTYVHIVSEDNQLRFVMNEMGLMVGVQQLEPILITLDDIARSFEGKLLKSDTGADNTALTPGLSVDTAATQGISLGDGEAQIPIPCKTCGAAMRPTEQALHEQMVVECDYCHTTETLPADARQRAQALKLRLSQIKWAQDTQQGLDKTMGQLGESGLWLPALGILLGMGGWQILNSIQQLQTTKKGFTNSVSVEERINILSTLVGWNLLTAGILIGVAIAIVGMFLRYRFAVRPKMLARPPQAGHKNLRCRQCGGDLPSQTGPFINCHFCQAQNLVTPKIAQQQAVLLDQEVKEYQKRAAAGSAAFQNTVKGATNFYYYALGGGLAFGIALSQIAKWLIPLWVN